MSLFELKKENVYCLYHLDNDISDATGHTVASVGTDRSLIDGKFGQTFSNCEFKITDLTDFPKGKFTVSFWLKIGGQTNSNSGLTSTSTNGYFFRIKGFLGLRNYYGIPRIDDLMSTNRQTKSLNDGEWHHVLIRYDGENYLNYSIDGQSYITNITKTIPALTEISFNSAYIDELMIYDGVPIIWDSSNADPTEPWTLETPKFGKVLVDYNNVKCLYHFENNLDDEMENITLSNLYPQTHNSYPANPNVNFGKYKESYNSSYGYNSLQGYSAKSNDEALEKMPQGDFTILYFTNTYAGSIEVNAKFINELNDVIYSENDRLIYVGYDTYSYDTYHYPSQIKSDTHVISFKANYNSVRASTGFQYIVIQYHSDTRTIYLYCNGFLIDKWQFDNVYGNNTYKALITGFKIPKNCDEFLLYDGLIYPNAINVEPSTTNKLFNVPTRDIRFNQPSYSDGDITIYSKYPLYKLLKIPTPLQQGYSQDIEPLVLRSKMTDGSIRQRLLNPCTPNTITCTVQFTSEEFKLFKAFYEEQLDYGSGWFVMPLLDMETNQIDKKLVRIQDGKLSVKLMFRNNNTSVYQITLKLDVDNNEEL